MASHSLQVYAAEVCELVVVAYEQQARVEDRIVEAYSDYLEECNMEQTCSEDNMMEVAYFQVVAENVVVDNMEEDPVEKSYNPQVSFALTGILQPDQMSGLEGPD